MEAKLRGSDVKGLSSPLCVQSRLFREQANGGPENR